MSKYSCDAATSRLKISDRSVLKQDRSSRPDLSAEQQFQHESLRTPLSVYVLHGRWLVIASAPLLYASLIPLLLLDLFISVYQAVCFPIYEIPKVRRHDYFIFDRGDLRYLNILERANCTYCSYANGLIAYIGEIAGRTEQHWCPIKHSRALQASHSRYQYFLPFGDATTYRLFVDKTRKDFGDLKKSH